MGGISDDEIRNKTKKLLDQSHLTVCYAAQPELLGAKLNPNALQEEDRKMAEEALLRGVDEAENLGAGGISFVSGQWEQLSEDRCYQQLIKTTKAVCEYASKKNMGVNLEVFDFDMDKEVLIGPAPLAARFAADMGRFCDNFGLLIDLSHIPTTHETSRFVIKTLKPYIKHLHIGNAVVKKGCEAYGDKHPRFGFPNSANDVEELVEFFEVLKEEGFFNEKDPMILSIEVKPWGDEDADIIVANTKRVINRAWALIRD
jgi:sugar phosphate isomerase/epimerase